MEQMKRSFLKYPGSKLRFVDLINKEINSLDEGVNTYFEPFLGSGAVFLNLEKKFNFHILSDADRNIIKIWEIFNYGFEELNDFYKTEVLKYGNPGREKKAYYKIRDELNLKYFNTDSKEESFYFYCLSRNVINSMLRFGKKGINQGWGNGGYDLNLTKKLFNEIKIKLKNTEVLEFNFFEIFKEFKNQENILFFLDPPYEKTVIKTYKGTKDNEEVIFNKKNFLIEIKKSKSKIIYTDVYDEETDNFLNWRIVPIRIMKSIQPRSQEKGGGKETGIEVMYINY